MPYKCDGTNCQKRHDLVVEMGCAVPTHTSPECWYIGKDRKNYVAELRLLEHDFVFDVNTIAERVRQEVIIPFCDKHNLKFISAMGDWSFSSRGDEGTDNDDWDQYLEGNIAEDPDDPGYVEYYKPPENYVKIRELLVTIVYGNDMLFEYMKDYHGTT